MERKEASVKYGRDSGRIMLPVKSSWCLFIDIL